MSERVLTPEMELRREEMLGAAFRLFTERNIDSVSMGDVAAETDYTLRTLHRYFNSKDDLVIGVSAWAMASFTRVNRPRSPEGTGTAAETYAFFIDSFLTLYREHPDILRFNHFFNVYIHSRLLTPEQVRPYTVMIDAIRKRFHAVYLKGQSDGTLRTEIPEDEMFSMTLHLMLAVVTRYAVGLVYDSGVDAESELLAMREMLLARHTCSRGNSPTTA